MVTGRRKGAHRRDARAPKLRPRALNCILYENVASVLGLDSQPKMRGEGAMHALVIHVSLEPGHREEGRKELETRVVPAVKQAPGVVSGYWSESPEGDHGYSMVFFESEATAQAGGEMARNGPRPDFITFDKVEVCEVVAQF